MAIVDLTPDVVEVLDYETILAERKATLVSLYPEEQQEAVARTLTLESEPIVKLLEENAYREVIWRQRVNEAARAVMLAYAEDADLDQIPIWRTCQTRLTAKELRAWRYHAN